MTSHWLNLSKNVWGQNSFWGSKKNYSNYRTKTQVLKTSKGKIIFIMGWTQDLSLAMLWKSVKFGHYHIFPQYEKRRFV